MNRLDTTITGRLTLRNDRDLGFLQSAIRNTFDRLSDAYIEFVNEVTPLTPDNCVILYGCVASGSSCSAGAILYRSPVTGLTEIGRVDAHTIPTSRPLVFVPIESDGAGSPVTMEDASSKRFHVDRRFELQALTTQLDYAKGADTVSGVGQPFTMKQVVSDMGHELFEPRMVFTASVLDRFNKTTGLGEGRWRRWAFCDGSNATPNLKNRFVIGMDSAPSGADTDHDVIGDTGGAKRVTLTGAESGRPVISISPTGQLTIFGSGGTIQTGSGLQAQDLAISLNAIPAANASSSHQNEPPFFTLAYICRIV